MSTTPFAASVVSDTQGHIVISVLMPASPLQMNLQCDLQQGSPTRGLRHCIRHHIQHHTQRHIKHCSPLRTCALLQKSQLQPLLLPSQSCQTIAQKEETGTGTVSTTDKTDIAK